MSLPVGWGAAPSLRDVDTSAACADLGSHARDDQRDHLLACEPCWIRSAKMYVTVCEQIEERRWTAGAGLPVDGHVAWSVTDFV